MEHILRQRLKLRHTSLRELLNQAQALKDRSEGEGVTLQEITLTVMRLKNTTRMFERESLSLAEVSLEENQDILMRDQMKAEELIVNLEMIQVLYTVKTPTEETAVSMKLPKLDVAKFDGDILKWPEFWDKFEMNIHRRNLSRVDKLSYLFGALTGRALDTIRGIDITNDNYDMALDTLKERFGNKSLVIEAHYDALTRLPKSEEDTQSTLDSVKKHLRILDSLGEDTKGNYLKSLVCSKFSEKVNYELNLLTTKDRDMESILKTLDKIVTAEEHSKMSQRYFRDRGSIPSGPSSTTEVLHVKTAPNRKRKFHISTTHFQSKKNKRECAFCGEDHYSDQCMSYKSYAQRIKQLRNRCYGCFEKGHRVRVCRAKIQCRYCRGSHNRALCNKRLDQGKGINTNRMSKGAEKTWVPNKERKKPQSNVIEVNNELEEVANCLPANVKSYLQTATAQIRYKDSNVPVRLLLDCGSQRSYLTSKLAQSINLQADRDDQLLIYTFGSNTPQETTSPSAEVTLVTKRGCEKSIRVNIIPHITDNVLVCQLKTGKEIDIPADDASLGECIDLLIGNDYYFSLLRDKYSEVHENLYLVDTDLGWIISGRISEADNEMTLITYCQCHGSGCPYFSEPDLPLRNIDMKFLWSLESIGIVDSPKASREEEAVKYFNDTVIYENERYAVKWPWIQYPPELPTNFGLAFGRLRSMLHRADERTLKDYDDIISEQLNAGIIEVVEPRILPTIQTTPPVHYLPHHIVKQSGKKGRIVYDASAKIKEERSLNECMFRGPSMLEDLTALLLKFRTGKIGITADVEKAFLQISLQEEDRDVTRFLWVKDTSTELSESNLLHYRFCRVHFGIIASPFLLTATIRHYLSESGGILLNRIADRCYVDNLVTETKTLKEACELYEEARETFGRLSMNIRDWVSNDKEFMKTIPDKNKAKECDQVKVLGLTWNLADDTLHLKVPQLRENNPLDKKTTKKDVLKTLARLYDPCGFASPLILPAKMLFQETCVRKLKWNSVLPPDLNESWQIALENLEAIKDINVSRYLGSTMLEENVRYELHCFCDASKNAYAAVVYVVLRGISSANTAFLMSKSRITPVEEKNDLKIPRLELLGFLIGSRLLKYVADNLGTIVDEKYLWTDSLIVLAWMKTNKLLPPFVSRRVNEIKQSRDVEFKYVPTQMNPADVATRPGAIQQKSRLWFSGPDFLFSTDENWPAQHCDEQKILCSAGEALDFVDYPEMVDKGYENVDSITDVLYDDTTEEAPISEQASSVLEDETKLVKALQAKFYTDEVAGKQTSLARNLGLFLDTDGVLRCKGRLANADWTYDKKFPILIPRDCEFTNKLIMEIHEKNYHVGVSHTLSLIRQRYWIPQGRAQVQRSIKKCPQCIKHGGGPYKLPDTPALPTERARFSTPFTYTGMDYFGPAFVQTSVAKEKRWICLYTCLAVRAIHLEVVNDLTAEECLMGLRRFIASRGKPNVIVSDNATQFKLTSEILANPHCIQNRIKWKFIPQLAPWHGGVYERLIALVKNCLKRTLDKHLLQDGQLVTVMKEVEAVLNTRPLVRVGSEVEDVLRPADFLSLGSCLEMTPSAENYFEGTTTKIDLLRSWKRGQVILNEFKKMFHNLYLPSLRERYRQHPRQPRITSKRSPQLGDIVQIKDDSKNRNNWKVGKISALIRGQDGECRVAKVKIGDCELTRSVGHLYPLEAEVGGNELDKLGDTSETEPLSDALDQSQVPGSTLPEIYVDREETPEVLEGENTPVADVDLQREQVDPQTNRVDVGGTTVRVGREAAARAREKIAEWTRHLLTTL